jgi:23S rRNA (adenine2503-C2)-methyltransferase
MQKVALMLPSLYGQTPEELREILKKAGLPAFRGDQLAGWLYQKHIASLEEAKNLPASMREYLAKNFKLSALRFDNSRHSINHESSKFLFQTHDGYYLESVLITQKDRRTVCVSTQLGCKMGCVFCASGKAKFLRNLTAGEIIEQVVWIEKDIAQPVTNVVFMGMGEPLDNFEETMKALAILQAPWGFGMGARRITVSTSGITPKILEFVKRSEGRVRLSVSLHAADEAKRTELVPINKAYSIRQLMKTLQEIHRQLKREITFEYTLIGGVNDSPRDAEGVAKLALQLQAKVNLIPYNPIHEMHLETPKPERIDHFRTILERRGVRVTLRQTAGRDINAACGQLRLEKEQARAPEHKG